MSTTKEDIAALYQEGIAILGGKYGEPGTDDMVRAKQCFEQAAKISPAAQAKLAVVQALRGEDDKKTAQNYVDAVMSGLPALLREMGALLISEGQIEMAGPLLRRAAGSGDWIAVFLMLREAERGRFFAAADDLHLMSTHLSTAVPFRSELINRFNILTPAAKVVPSATVQTAKMQQAVIKALQPEGKRNANPINANPAVESLIGVLPPVLCDYLIAISCGLMQPSKVVDPTRADSVDAGYRTSDGAVLLPVHMDMPLMAIIRQLSKAADCAPEQGEFLSLLRYRPGQEYKPHHDYLDEDAADYSKVVACGQRQLTLLTYLNTGYEGGETVFPQLDVHFKGAPGDSLLFDNTDSRGRPLPASQHAGLPVKQGEKWLATLWIRQKPFWSWAR